MKRKLLVLLIIGIIAGFSSCAFEPDIDMVQDYVPFEDGSVLTYRLSLTHSTNGKNPVEILHSVDVSFTVSHKLDDNNETLYILDGGAAVMVDKGRSSVSENTYKSICDVLNSTQLIFKFNPHGLSLNGISFDTISYYYDYASQTSGNSNNRFEYFSDMGIDILPVYLVKKKKISSALSIDWGDEYRAVDSNATYASTSYFTKLFTDFTVGSQEDVIVEAGSYDNAYSFDLSSRLDAALPWLWSSIMKIGVQSTGKIHCAYGTGFVKGVVDFTFDEESYFYGIDRIAIELVSVTK